MNPQIIDTIKIVLTTFICSSLIMPVMKQIAKHIGAIDMPRSEEGNRHIHKRPIPKLILPMTVLSRLLRLRKKTARLLWIGLWVLLPSRKKARFTMV